METMNFFLSYEHSDERNVALERKTFGTNALNADKCALCNIPGGLNSCLTMQA